MIAKTFRQLRSAGPRLLALIVLSTAAAVAQPASPNQAAAASAFVPLFKTPEHKFQGPLPAAEFFFQLPEHIEMAPGSQLVLKYRASPLLIPDISTATFEVNGTPATSIRLPGKPESDGGLQMVTIALSDKTLKTGWNKVSVKCLMQTTDVHCRDIDNPACWFVLEQGSGIKLSFRRLKLFPEPARFPASITEEQLLRQDELVEGFPSDKITPTASVLVPEALNNTSFRAFVVAAARLGQPGYLPAKALRVGKLADWQSLSGQVNGILIGLKSDLESMDLPVDTRSAVSVLEAGDGLVAEFITGEAAGSQRRWIVVAGADEAGLTKALLTLGSSDALGTTATNPAIVRDVPKISPLTEKLAQPHHGVQTFEKLNGGRLVLRGVFRNQAILNWALPPGYETAPGSELLLEMAHSEGLERASAVMFEVNERLLPSVSLQRAGVQQMALRLQVPDGIPGRAPNRMIVTSYLDIGTVDCSHRNEERAWVEFSADSYLKIETRPLRIDGLDRLNLVLLRDAFMRRACILLPAGATTEDLEVVRDVALNVGGILSTMPILWPQAALYGADQPVPEDAVKTTSAILFGSAGQWKQALPADTRLTIDAASADNLRLLNSEVPHGSLAKGLVLAQFLNSPWSADNCVVTIGGATSIGGANAAALITNPDVLAKVGGTVSGLDGKGRVFSYDVRAGEPQSLAERIMGSMPKDLSAEQTEAKLKSEEKWRGYMTTRNFVIFGIVLLIVILMIRAQVRLRSRQAAMRRKDDNQKS